MSDVTKRLKHHLWANYAIDPMAVVVTVVNGKAVNFGVDSNHAHSPGRQIPQSVEFEGGTVTQINYDGASGPQPGSMGHRSI